MPAYRILVPELAEKLEIGAMELVRDCAIAVGTAYRAMRGDCNLDTCWKIYTGLYTKGYRVSGRRVRWNDVVDFGEFGT